MLELEGVCWARVRTWLRSGVGTGVGRKARVEWRVSRRGVRGVGGRCGEGEEEGVDMVVVGRGVGRKCEYTRSPPMIVYSRGNRTILYRIWG